MIGTVLQIQDLIHFFVLNNISINFIKIEQDSARFDHSDFSDHLCLLQYLFDSQWQITKDQYLSTHTVLQIQDLFEFFVLNNISSNFIKIEQDSARLDHSEFTLFTPIFTW